jgi:outer membrane protein OmpA-like peptidoglycan-associated protein
VDELAIQIVDVKGQEAAGAFSPPSKARTGPASSGRLVCAPGAMAFHCIADRVDVRRRSAMSKMRQLWSDDRFLKVIQKSSTTGAVAADVGLFSNLLPHQEAGKVLEKVGEGVEKAMTSRTVDAADPFTKFTVSPRAVFYAADGGEKRIRFPGGTLGKLELDAGQSGNLKLDVTVEVVQDVPDERGKQVFVEGFSVTWVITGDPSGTLTIEARVPEMTASKGRPSYRLDSVETKEGASSVSAGAATIGSTESGEIGYIVGLGSAKPPPKPQVSCSIDIKVNKPKPAEPEFTVDGSQEIKSVVKVEHTIKPFVSGKTMLEGGASLEGILHDLLETLPTETRNAIINGKPPGGEVIEVHGHADMKGHSETNWELSGERALAVIEAFKSAGAHPDVFSKPIRHGERKVPNRSDVKGEEIEDPQWRKVVLSINHVVTAKVPKVVAKGGQVGDASK